MESRIFLGEIAKGRRGAGGRREEVLRGIRKWKKIVVIRVQKNNQNAIFLGLEGGGMPKKTQEWPGLRSGQEKGSEPSEQKELQQKSSRLPPPGTPREKGKETREPYLAGFSSRIKKGYRLLNKTQRENRFVPSHFCGGGGSFQGYI